MEFETTPIPLDLSTKEKKESTVLTEESFSDLNFIHLGSGAQSIIADIQTGLYIGAEQFTSAPFSVDFDGKVIASDITITGGSISGITLSGLSAGSDINILGWTSTMTFSATDYRTITWTSGVITLANGTTFSIGTGNTGNMAATTYIYFDKTVSTTALQITTTAADAVGANKILIAVAQNNSDIASKAILQVFGGKGGQLITVDQIAANSASVNEFISNTAQIKDAVITSAKIASLNADVINAGTITGRNIQTATTGYRQKMNSALNQYQFLSGDTIRGYMTINASGDVIINAVDDVEFAIGGTIKCGAYSGSFKPNSDKAYDLGADNAQWNNVYGTKFYGGSSATGGWDFTTAKSKDTNQTVLGFVTSGRVTRSGDKINLDFKFRELIVNGGIVTGVSAETDWIFMEDASVLD